jgi:hypothetical protein
MSCRPCGPSRSPVGRRVEGCGGVCSIALRACGRLTGRPSKPSTNHPPCDRMATDWRALSPSRRSRPWWPGALSSVRRTVPDRSEVLHNGRAHSGFALRLLRRMAVDLERRSRSGILSHRPQAVRHGPHGGTPTPT